MKNLIKKILREQWSPEAIQDLEAFHPDLFELDEQETTGDGSWKNPFDTPTPGNVPTQSYQPRTERKDNKHHIVPVPKIAFFKATERAFDIFFNNGFINTRFGNDSLLKPSDRAS